MTGRHILVVSIPAWGHTYPMLSWVAELAGRGHRVSWLSTGAFEAEIGKAAEPVH